MRPVRRWFLVLALVGVALGGLVWLNVFLVGSPFAPLATVKRFYDAAGHGRPENAYATFHPDLSAVQSYQGFKTLAEKHAPLFEAKLRMWQTVANDGSVAVIQGDITTSEDEAVVVWFTLAKHEGDWRILAYSVEGASGAKVTGGRE